MNMKNCKYLVLVIAMLGLAAGTRADTIIQYQFTYTGVIANVTSPTILAPHVTGTNYDFYSDASTSKGFEVSGGNPGGDYYGATTIASTSAYMFFPIQVENQYSLTLSNLTFDSRRNIHSATSYDVEFSTNGTSFTSLGNGSLTGTTWQNITANNGAPISNLTGTVYLRIYGNGWSGSADANQNWYQDNVTVNGSVVAVPEPSTVMLAGVGIVSLLVLAKRRGQGLSS